MRGATPVARTEVHGSPPEESFFGAADQGLNEGNLSKVSLMYGQSAKVDCVQARQKPMQPSMPKTSLLAKVSVGG